MKHKQHAASKTGGELTKRAWMKRKVLDLCFGRIGRQSLLVHMCSWFVLEFPGNKTYRYPIILALYEMPYA